MPRTVIRRCRALVGTDARLTPAPVDVVIDGERIAAVVDGGTAPAAAIEIDGARLLAAPGLINGHYHSWDHYQKGCLENLPLELFMAYVRPPDRFRSPRARSTSAPSSGRSRRCAAARR